MQSSGGNLAIYCLHYWPALVIKFIADHVTYSQSHTLKAESGTLSLCSITGIYLLLTFGAQDTNRVRGILE